VAVVTLFVCDVFIAGRPTGAEELVLCGPATAISHGKAQLPEGSRTARSKSQDAANPILEMRPAHKSLRDVAREKMSEFERKYPW
jgi:hypothetical protein